MDNQQELAGLVKDLIGVNQALAISLERILISIEQISGRIPEDRELSTIVSQLSGLYLRARDIAEAQTSGVSKPAKGGNTGKPVESIDVRS